MAAPPNMRSIVRYKGKLMRVEGMSDSNSIRMSGNYHLRDLASGELQPYELIAWQNLKVVKVPCQQYKAFDFRPDISLLVLEHDPSYGSLAKGAPLAFNFTLTITNPLHSQILEKIEWHCDLEVEFVFFSGTPYITGFISFESQDPEIQKLNKKKLKREQRKLKAAQGFISFESQDPEIQKLNQKKQKREQRKLKAAQGKAAASSKEAYGH